MTKAARAIFTQEILPLFEQTREQWLKQARATARYLARRDGHTNINAVRAECPPPEGCDPRCLGAVFTTKEFVKIGYENSDRRTCHGRPIAQFSIKGAT